MVLLPLKPIDYLSEPKKTLKNGRFRSFLRFSQPRGVSLGWFLLECVRNLLHQVYTPNKGYLNQGNVWPPLRGGTDIIFGDFSALGGRIRLIPFAMSQISLGSSLDTPQRVSQSRKCVTPTQGGGDRHCFQELPQTCEVRSGWLLLQQVRNVLHQI
jgi:hypothetical protein